jgi:hypothetical protein
MNCFNTLHKSYYRFLNYFSPYFSFNIYHIESVSNSSYFSVIYIYRDSIFYHEADGFEVVGLQSIFIFPEK